MHEHTLTLDSVVATAVPELPTRKPEIKVEVTCVKLTAQRVNLYSFVETAAQNFRATITRSCMSGSKNTVYALGI